MGRVRSIEWLGNRLGNMLRFYDKIKIVQTGCRAHKTSYSMSKQYSSPGSWIWTLALSNAEGGMSVDIPPILHVPLWRVERRLYFCNVKYVVESFEFLRLWPVSHVCSIRRSQAKCCSRHSVTLHTETFEMRKSILIFCSW